MNSTTLDALHGVGPFSFFPLGCSCFTRLLVSAVQRSESFTCNCPFMAFYGLLLSLFHLVLGMYDSYMSFHGLITHRLCAE